MVVTRSDDGRWTSEDKAHVTRMKYVKKMVSMMSSWVDELLQKGSYRHFHVLGMFSGAPVPPEGSTDDAGCGGARFRAVVGCKGLGQACVAGVVELWRAWMIMGARPQMPDGQNCSRLWLKGSSGGGGGGVMAGPRTNQIQRSLILGANGEW